jgi:GAF domain
MGRSKVVSATEATLPRLKQAFLRGGRIPSLAKRLVSDTQYRLSGSDAMLWELQSNDTELVPVASAQTPIELFERIRVPVADSIVGVVIATGMPTLLGPGERHHPLAEQISGIATAWMVAAPIYAVNDPLGVLSCIRSDPAVPFTSSDLEFITFHAELLGILLSHIPDVGDGY